MVGLGCAFVLSVRNGNLIQLFMLEYWKKAAVDYTYHVRRDEGDYSVSQNFMDNGIVVLDPKKDCSAQGTLGFLKNVLHEKLVQSNQGMDYLKHIIKQQSNHPGRTWKQLYPSTGGDRIKNLPWTKTISGLRLFLEKIHFARFVFCTHGPHRNFSNEKRLHWPQ